MESKPYSYEKIEKPTIIITSLGRTGTKFFQALFESQLPEACSLHEPDVFNYFQYKKGKERISQVKIQLKEVGLFNLLIRKPLGRWSLINISDDRVRGAIDQSSTVKKVYNQRDSFIKTVAGSPYIESNIGYYGLLDVLDNVFSQFRAAYFIRDGRDWIQSHMNWGQMYGKNQFQKIFAHTWPTAHDFGDVTIETWESMSRFEKLCRAWVRLNEFAINSIADNPFVRLVKFEDIFISDNRYQNLEDLLNFLLSIDNSLELDVDSINGWLEKRIHGSQENFPDFPDWSKIHKAQFHEICDPLMKYVGYL